MQVGQIADRGQRVHMHQVRPTKGQYFSFKNLPNVEMTNTFQLHAHVDSQDTYHARYGRVVKQLGGDM